MKKKLTMFAAVFLLLFASGCQRPLSSGKPASTVQTVAPAENRAHDYRLVTSGCVLDKMAMCVVLVDFDDVTCSTDEAQWSSKFFGTGGSLREYYLSSSKNRLDIFPASESSGENDGVVRVRLSRDHPKAGEPDEDGFTRALVNEILRQADAYIDYSVYDQNGDDILWPTEFTPVIVLAGYEQDFEEYADDPAMGAYMQFTDEDDRALVLDDSSIEAYIMMGELVYDYTADINRLNTVEIIAHETGHALGLPDLYDTDDSSLGVGIHSVMGSCVYQDRRGNLNEYPVELDAWSMMFLGFAGPQIVTQAGVYTLYDDQTGQENILLIPTRDPDEYFLLENRQFVGYDAVLQDYMTHSGICILHINNRYIEPAVYEVDGFVNVGALNDNEDKKGVDIVEANESVLGYAQLDLHEEEYYTQYDHYFSAAGVSEFSAQTHPSTTLSSGEPTGISVRVLSDGFASNVEVSFTQ